MENKRCAARRFSALILSALFAALLMAAPLAARAENNCPWMNEATASDLVGGDSTGVYLAAKDKAAVCTFTEHAGKATRTLTISVEITNDPHASFLSTLQTACRSASSPLQAIGNEAAACPIDRRKAVMGERALGRVRDQVFIISINTSMKNDPVLTPAMLKMKIDTAAEQVAGNLF